MRPAVSSRRREPGPGSDPAGRIQRSDLLDGRGRSGFLFVRIAARPASFRDDLTSFLFSPIRACPLGRVRFAFHQPQEFP